MTIETNIITLYDITSNAPDQALKYKSIFVNFTDIESVSIQFGAKPTGTKFDGSGQPRYIFPMIHDSRQDYVVSDLFKIAKYLDEAYPDTPQFLPQGQGTKTLQAVFISMFEDLWPITIPAAHAYLDSRAQESYRKVFEAFMGKKLEEG